MYGENIYGTNLYGKFKDEDYKPIISKRNLINYLPSYYHKENHTKMMNIPDYSITNQFNYIHSLAVQRHIDSATWGLIVWEEELGISNQNYSIEQRREIIKSKLRGAGRTTILKIKNMAIAFSNGDVSVYEDIENFTVVIKFIGTLGIPNNMEAFDKSMNEIIPAHLNYKYEYAYNTCGDVLSWGITCGELLDLNITCGELMTYNYEKKMVGGNK